ncbi:hypothetical protein ACGFWI_10645 [Streptomyces sp. NPDC048434]|uniref:hypothetical protein n=1 Tax=Streptomyces sp. NPDC048434 TaxID=3365549 RepID=UPI00371E67C3
MRVDSGDKLTVCDERADGLTVQVYVVHTGGPCGRPRAAAGAGRRSERARYSAKFSAIRG